MNDPYGLIASGLPPEMIEQMMGLKNRDAVIQAMLQQQVPQAEAKGRFTAVTPPLALALHAGTKIAGQKLAKDSEKEWGNLASKRQQSVADALMQYEKTRSGVPGVPVPMPVTGDDEGNAMPPAMAPATPGDPRKAVMQAMMNPMLQGNPMVAADLKSYEKSQEPYDLRQGAKRMVGDKVIAENAPKPAEHVIGGKVYVTTPTGVVEKGGPGDPMASNRPFNADGTPNTAYQQYEKDKANLGATRVQTNVNAFTPASEEAQRDFMKSTRTTYDQLKQAPVALESIEKAKALVPGAKGFMGPGGEGLLGAAKFLNNRMGMNIDTEGVNSAEELRTRIFFNIMDNLKKMDAQPSQQQQQIMQQSLGNLGTDPNALPKVLDAFGDAIRGKVDLHNKEVAGATSRGVKFPYDPTIDLTMPKRRASDKPGAVIRFDAQGNPL